MGQKEQKKNAAKISAGESDGHGSNGPENQDQPQVSLRNGNGEADADRFPIVAIGASAGGLKVLRELFDHMPPDSGCTFVVVMHLSPDHESQLEQLLQPHTKMRVRQVTQTVVLEKNCIYLIPPNANLNAIDSHLRLSELEPRGRGRAPIDHFFKTLPQAHDAGVIGILLSGTGSDGTQGLRTIKEYNGLSIVQDPAEAEYGGMPQSAISAVAVDLVLPVVDIPAAVMSFVTTWPDLKLVKDERETDKQTQKFLQQVFAIVRSRTGRDFTHYKRTTVLRRILRRMQFNQISRTDNYLELMRTRPDEAKALADDLLIVVTNFFRDPEVYTALEKKVVPMLFADKGAGDAVRVWSAGCATGEEAYSLAILLIEEMERHDTLPSVQIFASDLHEKSLSIAREGFYPGDVSHDVGETRLRRFFSKENGGYRINREVREMVVFAQHNLLADPPFSRIDLISCRNMLIYLERSLQPQVTELFHYALQEDGFLVLGSSENVTGSDLFQTEDKKHAIYRRRKVPAPEVRLPVFPLAQVHFKSGLTHSDAAGSHGSAAYGALHQDIVEQYAPPSVLLSPDDNIVHSSAQAGRYLLHPAGLPSTNIFKVIREELRIELRKALLMVRKDRRVIQTRPVSIRCDGQWIPVELDLRPAVKSNQDGFVLLIFNDRPRPEILPDDASSEGTLEDKGSMHSSSRIRQLETEKHLAENRLQQIIEEHELSKEEIKASNEELQSANEELRSTLEELETSKEELQSTNEELHTLNQENLNKVEELNQLSSDLQNLLVATDIATLFLDRQHRIVRFTPRIEQLFNVQAGDRGRYLADFTSRLGYTELDDDVSKVTERLIPVEREVQDESGGWYLCRILPYRDLRERISGTVVTFVDITRLKLAEEEVLKAKNMSETIIDRMPVPLLVLTPKLEVRAANTSFYNLFRVDSPQTLGRRVYDLGNGQWNNPGFRDLLERVLPDKKEFTGYEVDYEFEGLGRRVMLLNALELETMGLILLGIHDITERRLAEERLLESARRKDDYLAILGHELRNPLSSIRSGAEILRSNLPDDDRLRRTIDVLHRQTRHMATIIDGLLDVSRIARNKITINLQNVDIRSVLDQVIKDRSKDLSACGLKLVQDISLVPLWVRGDYVRLSQVLDNLLSNAIKFTQSPGTLTVAGYQDDTEVVIRVQDTGMGINPERLTDIFEAFQQGRQDVARSSGGLGLGLSLAKGLVKLHGGTIEAHSDGPDTGSAFVIRLPVAAAPAGGSSKIEPVDGIAPQRILVVEDNEDAALMTKELLESCGHIVKVAENGESALDAMHHGSVDVVLCDLGLPGLSGCELARIIRADSVLGKVPLIAVTGYGQSEDRRRALEAGFSEHMVKPVEIEALTAVLRRIL